MNSIWKAPWGNHIDLSKIVSTEGPHTKRSGYMDCSFKIHFQLMDKPLWVSANTHPEAGNQDHINMGKEIGYAQLQLNWYAELIKVWSEFKSQNK